MKSTVFEKLINNGFEWFGELVNCDQIFIKKLPSQRLDKQIRLQISLGDEYSCIITSHVREPEHERDYICRNVLYDSTIENLINRILEDIEYFLIDLKRKYPV